MRINKLANPTIFLHILFFLIIASSSLTYWEMANYASNQSWDLYFYKYTKYLDLVPTWQKVLKDLLSILLLILSIYFPRKGLIDFSPDKKLKQYYISFFLILFFSLSNLLGNQDVANLNLFTVFAAVRPYLIITCLLFFCHKHLNFLYFRILLESVNIIGIIQIYYSILQRHDAVIKNGLSWLHSGSARSVGTFADPNTMGRFLALLLMVNLFFLPPNKIRLFLIIGYAIATFFTGSRASLLMIGIFFILFIGLKLSNKTRALVRAKSLLFGFLITIPLLQILLLRINTISNRVSDPDSAIQDGRFQIFFSLFDQFDFSVLVVGNYLGYGSNALSIVGQGSNSFLSDSTPASLLGQFGIIGLFLFLLITISLFKQFPRYLNPNHNQDNIMLTGNLLQNRNALVFYIIISIVTTILLESYAVLPILLGLIFYDNLKLGKNNL